MGPAKNLSFSELQTRVEEADKLIAAKKRERDQRKTNDSSNKRLKSSESKKGKEKTVVSSGTSNEEPPSQEKGAEGGVLKENQTNKARAELTEGLKKTQQILRKDDKGVPSKKKDPKKETPSTNQKLTVKAARDGNETIKSISDFERLIVSTMRKADSSGELHSETTKKTLHALCLSHYLKEAQRDLPLAKTAKSKGPPVKETKQISPESNESNKVFSAAEIKFLKQHCPSRRLEKQDEFKTFSVSKKGLTRKHEHDVRSYVEHLNESKATRKIEHIKNWISCCSNDSVAIAQANKIRPDDEDKTIGLWPKDLANFNSKAEVALRKTDPIHSVLVERAHALKQEAGIKVDGQSYRTAYALLWHHMGKPTDVYKGERKMGEERYSALRNQAIKSCKTLFKETAPFWVQTYNSDQLNDGMTDEWFKKIYPETLTPFSEVEESGEYVVGPLNAGLSRNFGRAHPGVQLLLLRDDIRQDIANLNLTGLDFKFKFDPEDDDEFVSTDNN